MLFVIEHLLRDRKAKIAEWERNGARWIDEQTKQYGYGYDMDAWERRHPYPVKRLKDFWYVWVVFLGSLTVGYVAYLIITMPEPQKDPNNPNGCSVVVKKGDKVGVTAGDFKGSQGVIIEQRKDCSVNLTLTDSTWSMKKAKEAGYNGSDSLENGAILNVDKSSNIVKL